MKHTLNLCATTFWTGTRTLRVERELVLHDGSRHSSDLVYLVFSRI